MRISNFCGQSPIRLQLNACWLWLLSACSAELEIHAPFEVFFRELLPQFEPYSVRCRLLQTNLDRYLMLKVESAIITARLDYGDTLLNPQIHFSLHLCDLR